jgi:multicomponent Na+:H+ antiporter subunit E
MKSSGMMCSLTTARMSVFVWRTLLLAVLWWLITQGRMDAWLVGLPAVVLATLASVALDNEQRSGFSLAALPAFLILFLRDSVRGGLDVAWRTLGPKVRVAPGFLRYRLRVDHPAARVLLINCVSLLPGTLVADLDGDDAELHLLDIAVDPTPQLMQLEQAVGRLFGIQLETDDV